MRSGWLALWGVLLLSVAIGCSSKPKSTDPTMPNVRGTDEQIFIGDTIEKNYDPNVIMKRAEAFFDKEEYAEAIIEYQHFLDLHRVHTLAPYAQFKLAESHFKMFKTIDRDPEPIHKAIEHYEKLLKNYPGSRYEADATGKIHEGHDFLAQVHFMVGSFYYRKEAYLGAAHRFEYVMTRYPDMDIAADALYYLGLTYHQMHADDWAREKLVALAERYPNNKHKNEARQLLAKLGGRPSTSEIAVLPAAGQNGQNGQVGPEPVLASVSTQTNGAASSAEAQPQFTLCRLGVRCGPALATDGTAQPPTGANGHDGPQVASLSLNGGGDAPEPVLTPVSTAPHGAAPDPAPEVTICRLGVRCGPAFEAERAGLPQPGTNGANGRNGINGKHNSPVDGLDKVHSPTMPVVVPVSAHINGSAATASDLALPVTICRLGVRCGPALATDGTAQPPTGANGHGGPKVASLNESQDGPAPVIAPISTLPNDSAPGPNAAPQVKVCRLGVRC